MNKLILQLISIAKRSHYSCEEDNWYSCPKSPEGCDNENASNMCNCGADTINKEVENLAAAIKEKLSLLGLENE